MPATLKRDIIHRTGKPPKITEEICLSVAENMVRGVPLPMALHLETPVIPMAHWVNSLQGSTKLSAIYHKRLAEGIRDMMDEVNAAECLRKLPACIWKLERLWPEHFAQNKTPQHITINQTVVGLSNDVLARAAELVRRKTPEELANQAGRAESMRRNRRKAIPQAIVSTDAIDVQSSVSPSSDNK